MNNINSYLSFNESSNESKFKPRSYHSDTMIVSNSIFDDEKLLIKVIEKIKILEDSNIDYVIYYQDMTNGSFIRINFFPDDREKIRISKFIDNSYFSGYLSKEKVIELRKNVDWLKITKDEIIFLMRAKKFNL